MLNSAQYKKIARLMRKWIVIISEIDNGQTHTHKFHQCSSPTESQLENIEEEREN